MQIGQKSGHAVRVRISNEYLPEIIAGHQLDDLVHPLFIELVEYIIEKQNGLLSVVLPDEIEFRKLERYQEGLLLTL